MSDRLIYESRRVVDDMAQALSDAQERAKLYRSELKRVNKAQRALKLEYKELKRKYDEVLAAAAMPQPAAPCVRYDLDDGIPF